MAAATNKGDSVALRCDCGSLRGLITQCKPSRVNRGICYCDDCQAFARHLGHRQTLDVDGGTEILQFSSGQLAWTDGTEHLDCLQLTEDALLRWFAGCCRTPLANSLRKPWIPFVGLIASSIDPAVDKSEIERLAGPNRIRVHTKDALTDPERIAAGSPGAASMLLGLGRLFLGGWLRGEHRRSPFFDSRGEPRVTPRVLTAEELERAKQLGDAAVERS